MTFSSDFWVNLIYFLSQVLLGLIGIWIGIHLYFRQEKKEQDKRYNEILEHLQLVEKQILQFNEKMQKVDGVTTTIQSELIGTQREVIYRLTGVRQSLTDEDLPEVRKGKKKILKTNKAKTSVNVSAPSAKRQQP